MNQGNVLSGLFTVSEAIPAGMTFVSASPIASTDLGAGNRGTVTWVVPGVSELTVSGQTSFDIVLEVAGVTESP